MMPGPTYGLGATPWVDRNLRTFWDRIEDIVGRNTNAGIPAHCVSPTIMGVAYGGVHTHANVEAYFMEVVRKNRLVDASYLTNVWIPEDVTFTNRPMVTKKGASALTLVGTQTAAEFEPLW